jgi:hypothetical protein
MLVFGLFVWLVASVDLFSDKRITDWLLVTDLF